MTITEFLDLSGGDGDLYRKCISAGQRTGQAFFNALSEADQSKLRGSIYDPFYKDNLAVIYQAMDFLTQK